MTALVYYSLYVLFQGCNCRWDQMDRSLLPKQFAACLIDVCCDACSVVNQDDEPLDGGHDIFISMVWCSGEVSDCLGQLR